jgi:hypothetical protein
MLTEEQPDNVETREKDKDIPHKQETNNNPEE